jgi:uncharacterized protein (PEP-CTERM system associated)
MIFSSPSLASLSPPLKWPRVTAFTSVALAAALCCGGVVVQAQPAGPALPAAPGSVPVLEENVPNQAPIIDEKLLPTPELWAPTLGGALPKPLPAAAPRGWTVERSITARATATDNALLSSTLARKDLYLEVLPRLDMHGRDQRYRLDAMVGLDHVHYLNNSYSTRTDPMANVALNTTLAEKMLFLDASAEVGRRAITPFATQIINADPAQTARTQVYRLAPSFKFNSDGAFNASLRSDNNWTRRSGAALLTTDVDRVFSQNTQARLTREPLPFGFGLELGDQRLRYGSAQQDALRLQNGLVSVSYAFDPQFIATLLGGQEHSEFAGSPNTPVIKRNDTDKGLRLRWAPLNRSVFSAEVRERFFGKSFNVQWNHRSPFLIVNVSATREPNTQPEALSVSGDLVGQFDAIFRSRGYNAAQRQTLVRTVLNDYGLPDTIKGASNVYLNRAQLSTGVNAEMTFLGRRTATVLSLYKRRLEQLRRTGDLTDFPLSPGDSEQRGGQVALSFRWTPVVSFEGAYQFGRTQGLGFDVNKLSRDSVLSLGSNFAISKQTRVSAAVQHQDLKVSGSIVRVNRATVGLTHRF